MKKLLIFVLLSISTFAIGQGFEKKIDSLISIEFGDKHGPGGVFMIARNGNPIYEKAVGKSNLELDSELNTGSVFEIGSMTKQFTAVAVLLLQQEGKLHVDDPVSKYIPDYPAGNLISIRHLLTHTSGIKDFTKMKAISDIANKEMSPKQMVDFFKNETVDFAPGEKFDYNNSGYVLLGYLIEVISGKPYAEFIQRRIFDKVGMKDSYYASDRMLIKNRAYGYHQKSYGYVNKIPISFSVPFASGSLMSTLHDMLKWQQALDSNLLLTLETSRLAFAKNKLNSGEEVPYGFGWHLKDVGGIGSHEHGGSIFGFKSMAVYIPQADIYVVGFSNCDCNSPTQLVRDMALVALREWR